MAVAASADTNIWVGSLPLAYSETDVSALFSSCGTITSLKVLRDKATQVSKGAAMVNFSSSAEAAMAVQAVNGFQIDGHDKTLIVKAATAKVTSPIAPAPIPIQRSFIPAFSRPAAIPAVSGGTNVWAGNLPATISDDDVSALFGAYGAIVSFKILTKTRETETAAMVNYASASQASLAIQSLNGQTLSGGEKPLIVKLATPKGQQTNAYPVPPPIQYQILQPAFIPQPQQTGLPMPSDNLWVGNLPLAFTEADLNTLFHPYGTVIQSKILKPRTPTEPVLAAMVRFGNVAQAISAMSALNGFHVDPEGRPLEIRFASKKGESAPGPVHTTHGAQLFHPYR
jgi:RNA recognition motif-containing protein